MVKKQNIFSTKEWKDYDYQKDVREDPELQPLEPVGREKVDSEEKAKLSILASAKKQKPIVLDTDEKIEKYLK